MIIDIARLISDLASTTADPTQAVDIAVRDFADDMANLIVSEYPNVDRAAFIRACGFSKHDA